MIKQVNVLHIVPALFGKSNGIVGGAERYALEMARHMADVVPTTLVSFGDQGHEEMIGALCIRVLGQSWYVRGQRSNPLSLRLWEELRRADIVHCHQRQVLSSSLAAVFCRLTGRRVFVSDLGGGGWDISGYVSTDRWYHGHLHISEYSRKNAKHETQPWAHTIMGGVDIEKFSPDERVEKNGHVLFVGRLMPHKGINYLIEALPPDMNLEIIGQPYDQRFVEYLHELAAGKRVVFRYDCDDTALIDAYRRALCIVLPSVYRTVYDDETKVPELLGQTLLEGMACGTPAICTDVASMPEVVEDGVSGFVVPPNDPAVLREKLYWLQNHPEQAHAMGRAARQRVIENFTWLKVVNRCLEIYRKYD